MADKKRYPSSQLPIRKSVELLPLIFQTEANDKFLSGVLDPLIQPGVLDKVVGYIGRRYDKTYNSKDIYVDSDQTLRSRYQLEPGVIAKDHGKIEKFYDYIDFKNQLKFFNNNDNRDDKITGQTHYTWVPPIDWDKFINYREYYWQPAGPLTIAIVGQNSSIVSTYKVVLGTTLNSFVFTPDANTNNPSITLYRGQTYKFRINAPGEGFSIRTNYDTGSLLFQPSRRYPANSLVVYDAKLWRSLRDVSSLDTSSITIDSQDWQYIEPASAGTALEYSKGVTNNGIDNGVLTFEVPYDAPDVLYYQGLITPDAFGRFVIADIEANSLINVDTEIIGKTTYTSGNAVELSNGMVLEFRGVVTPDRYNRDTWLVEGVGTAITLTKFSDLIAPALTTDVPEVLFDNEGFDSLPFDDATEYASFKDYITIAKSSRDRNPWSRYNRWFHKSVIDKACQLRGQDFSAAESARAKRPIIEFQANLQLFDFGNTAKPTVDYIDTVTADVFSTIEGAAGYNIDGDFLFEGARILIVADLDKLANNRIYQVNFVRHNNSRRIHLRATNDTDSFAGQCVLIRRGVRNKGRMYHFNGTAWVPSQEKIAVNQPPLFDVFDKNQISVSNTDTYADSEFKGCKIVSYRTDTALITSDRFQQSVYVSGGIISTVLTVSDTTDIKVNSVISGVGFSGRQVVTAILNKTQLAISAVANVTPTGTLTFTPPQAVSAGTDRELGFRLSYLNIDNIGDILFDFNWDTEIFQYTIDKKPASQKISTGFYKFSESEYANCWQQLNTDYLQPIIDSQTVATSTDTLLFDTVQWDNIKTEPEIIFYINNVKYQGTFTRQRNQFVFDRPLSPADVVTIKIIADVEPDQGYYEIPIGLEKNPFNAPLQQFTLGQAVDHVKSSLEWHTAFNGAIPGASNLRDIADYKSSAKRFVKHNGLVPLAVTLLCDKTYNLIKSLQFAKTSYTEFKNNFILRAAEVAYTESINDFFDEIIASLTFTKNSSDAFSDSDTLGSGAFTSIKNTVEDTGIVIFSLSTKFSLDTASSKAVYVYKNGTQLLNSRDYEFDATFGFVKLTTELTQGDVIEIREYLSTGTNYIPPTPTSMGLYKKYTPMKFLDDTYVEPRHVIQGHDGSITAAYGDYRDDLLLELELRIYNNIKQQYDTEIFDIDSILGGYYGVGEYSKSQLDQIVAQDFLRWIKNTNINYTMNEYFDSENSFTYTYSRMSDPTRTRNIPGWWRGVYRDFYDTDRPHRCPWEMLGFSQKPTWWDTEYGPAPYTSNNLILWEDLENGHVRQGNTQGRYARYQRPGLSKHIPVDGDGKLLSPLDSNLAQDFALINNQGPFALGDMAPVEYAWRSSSEWPFAVVTAMCLMKPFEYVTGNFDRSRIVKNILDQYVYADTELFVTIQDLVPYVQDPLATGLVKYITDYTKSMGRPISMFSDQISKLDVALSFRMSGFVDQQQQKFLLDSKNPSSTTSSVFVPPENYDIIFNVSSPVTSVSYSGVRLEKSQGGWLVAGYDDLLPYFNYHQAQASAKDPTISVGGVSESFTDWIEDKIYNNGALVRYQSNFYRALKTHNSASDFDRTQWKKLNDVPKIGAIEAQRRRIFNTIAVRRLSYGTLLTSIQQVVDFLLGYESYLKTQGVVFDRYDAANAISQDWLSSAKEFMFWTKHNWEIGAIIALSPSAQKLQVSVPVGVADNLLDGFYDYQVLKGDGRPLEPRFINVNRSFQNINIETTNTTDGLYFVKLYFVLKEHVTIFDDRTVFNDIIYDKTTGYRQGRIKIQSFRTVDWDGDYTSPGFLFDNVNIQAWQPFRDYRLGDIVSYKSYNWTSLRNQLGTEFFSDATWSQLDSTPVKQLVPNFDYKINQFSDYFETSTDGVDQSQRSLARHAIGYQQRDYLQNLATDPVTQFQLYQGFIREKGTANSVTKIFDKLSRSGRDSVQLNEEWAFRLGSLGGVDQFTEIELQFDKNKFNLNPQPFLLNGDSVTSSASQYINLTSSDFTIASIPYSANIFPTADDTELSQTAGYVSLGQYQHVVKTLNDLKSLDISRVNENDHIWITFYQDSWQVFRLNETRLLSVLDLLRTDDVTVVLTLNRPHSIQVGEFIGLRDAIVNLSGFFEVTAVTNNTITLAVDEDIEDPEIDISTTAFLHLLTAARFHTYNDVDQRQAALLKNKSLLFIDDSTSHNNNAHSSKNWEVVEKNKVYSAKAINDYGTSAPLAAGSKVIYDNNLKHMLVGMPGSGLVIVYSETDVGLPVKQIISPPTGFFNAALGSFGEKMAVSPDSRYLVVGAARASGVTNNFMGEWQTEVVYEQDDIVLYGGRLYRALNANSNFVGLGDGSTQIAVNSDDWVLHTTGIPATTSGRGTGDLQQGMIAIYEYIDGRYVYSAAFVSPRPTDNELFGSEITLAVNGDDYYLAVSAIGSYNSTGRVYLYKFDGTAWTNMENPRYKGIYDFQESYRQGDIVWQAAEDPIAEGVRGNLWSALDDSTSDGSTITLESQNWLKVSDVSTHSSLPTNISVEDDGSTLEFAYTGLLTGIQKAELVKQGDKFGFSMAMNRDGSLLVIGAPDSDGQFFANYRGIWRPDVEYVEGEVVRHQGLPFESYQYYQLGDAFLGPDSTYRSYNEDPSDSINWQQVGDSSGNASGKIFVYRKTAFESYELTQMINAGSISSFSDMDSGLVISTGDQFGFAMDMNASGSTLAVSSPRADINFQDQGTVYVLALDEAALEYRVKQRLESFEIYVNEYFGFSVSVSPDAAKIAVGARNTKSPLPIEFDILAGTTFDNRSTRFYVERGFTGGVYVFDKKDQIFFLSEKLDSELKADESFGYSVDCVAFKIAVGSPYWLDPISDTNYGIARLFSTEMDAESLTILASQQPLVDLRKIKKLEFYDNVKNVKIQDIDYVDAAKGKILNLAEQEIKYKTPYDPAVYSIGTEDVVVDTSVNWLEKNVGKLWWNTNNAKFVYAEQNNIEYRVGNWNQLVPGASIDVYEWVESVLLPNEWAAVADTNEGLAQNISGQPLYPNNDVYSVKRFLNPSTGAVVETLYYYWVKDKAVIPVNMPDRTKSAAEVADLIADPTSTGVAFVAFVAQDKFATYNFRSIMQSNTALFNLQLRNSLERQSPIHTEHALMVEGVADSLPPMKLERKWIDSLIGADAQGNRVPATNLSAKQKYGINFRPRQSMFVDRLLALKITIEYINSILLKETFAESIDFTNLNLVDAEPSAELNLFDFVVESIEDRDTVGTVRVKQAVLRGNIINGELDTIDIVDPGNGYRPKELVDQEQPGIYIGPPIIIQGDGINAAAICHIDGQGRIIQTRITNRGKKYGTISLLVRSFAVLVRNDASLNNFWSVYSWDDTRKTYFRSRSQAFDTTKYWSRSDWTRVGYTANVRIISELDSIYDEPAISISIGDIIRIKEYASGGWAIFEKISAAGDTFTDRFLLIARQNGTIQLSSDLYNTGVTGIGFDNTQAFDTVTYDINLAAELRNIFSAVKNDIFVGDYRIEWNRLFFVSIRHVLSEQQYVDWVFKTSFLTASHTVGPLEQKINYKNDSLISYQEYINEAKPFRTTVREYVSRYDTVQNYSTSAVDFDLPPNYSNTDGRVVPISIGRSELTQYPWKWWTDNQGYSITAVQIYQAGTGYVTPPRVIIDGNGQGATAQSFISNGRVSGVKMLTAGSGYTSAPTVTLVGGNTNSSASAKAIAVLGDAKFRTFDLTMKFDRITKRGVYSVFSQTETFTASGTSSVFNLSYAPSNDKSLVRVKKNNEIILSGEYTISFFKSSADTYDLLRGRLILNQAPKGATGATPADVITVEYEKNLQLFDAVNRIDRAYMPAAGMASRETNQLMTGIDFGGVLIQGTTFDVTGGWDALPWFTDNWDSVQSSADYYHAADGSTATVTLPYVPAAGQKINVYLRRQGTQSTVRIDDEFYSPQNDYSTSINPNAEMPTFVGDGVNAVVVIGPYIQTVNGDTLIFRPIESDGSVTITDENILDTAISGGSLSAISGAYVTAQGITAEEISLSGGKFIEPDHVPAPEENIPGQVLEAVSIRVYNSHVSTSAVLQSNVTMANGTDTVFAIGQSVIVNNSIFVYVDNIEKTFASDYNVNLDSDTIEFNLAPSADSLIEILSIGLGGLGILDYQTFTADGATNLFLTNANFDYTSSVFVSVNGTRVDVAFKNSTDVVDAVGRTLIEFGVNPSAGDVIRIVALTAAADVDSVELPIVQVNTETFFYVGSTRSFDIDGFVDLIRGSSMSSVIVEANDQILQGPDTLFAVYDGSNNVFTLGLDPFEAGGSIVPTDIAVYINNILQTFIIDYTFAVSAKVLTINPARLIIGDNIRIENQLRAQYSIVNNNLVIASEFDFGGPGDSTADDSTSPTVKITWFGEYPSLDILSDQAVGGKVQYQLSRSPISADYVWVYKNGQRLRQQKDYYVSLPRAVVYLNVVTTTSDDIKIINFSNAVFGLPSAYEIHKDMLNVFHYNRFVKNSVKLSKALNYYDTTIEINDAAQLTVPVSARNLPGRIYIAGERIEYMTKIGNVLGQLRRGAQGTAIGALYEPGTAVIDVGYQETIPYNETQERTDFVSDGSTLLIGPLNYIPQLGTRTGSWYRNTIPATFGPCDQIEVFAGGRRLRKDPQAVWQESNGAASPQADQTQESEFSVDGASPFIRLTDSISAGTRITVLRRVGSTWYEKGAATASSGITLLDNNTAVAKFIVEKTTFIPE